MCSFDLQSMFQPQTGFLPLSLVGHVACSDDFLPPAAIQQLYSLFTATLCPPVGYKGAFEGQFIVSRERIRWHDWWTYHHLIVSSFAHSQPVQAHQ